MYFNVVSKLGFHIFYNNLDNLINNEIGLNLLLDNSNPDLKIGITFTILKASGNSPIYSDLTDVTVVESKRKCGFS